MDLVDRERLGRVLGRGARMAARTAYEAVDAATSQPPAGTQRRTPAAPEVIPPRASATAGTRTQTTASPADFLRAAAAARQGVTAAKQGVAAPLKRASKALWHELTGCFFALFALSFSLAAWNTRANAFSPVPNVRYRLYSFCALAAVFLYFSVSSFVRARKVT